MLWENNTKVIVNLTNKKVTVYLKINFNYYESIRNIVRY